MLAGFDGWRECPFCRRAGGRMKKATGWEVRGHIQLRGGIVKLRGGNLPTGRGSGRQEYQNRSASSSSVMLGRFWPYTKPSRLKSNMAGNFWWPERFSSMVAYIDIVVF